MEADKHSQTSINIPQTQARGPHNSCKMNNPPPTPSELKSIIKSCRQQKTSSIWDLDDNLPSSSFSLLSMSDAAIPDRDLGNISVLPVELIHSIFSSLDIYTLTNFQAVNRQALKLVCALPAYNKLLTHAPKTVHAILAAQAGPWIPIAALAEKLGKSQCETCGDFAPYLYILTCSRVCYLCFCSNKAYLPIPFLHAVRKFNLNKRARESLPLLWSVPGIYSKNERLCSKRHLLVDTESARRAAENTSHAAITPGQWRARQDLARKPNLWNRAVFQSRPKVRYAESWENGPDFFHSNPSRFMGIVRMPCVERKSGRLENGFACFACDGRRMFNVVSFEKHLSEEGEIRDGRHYRD